MAYSYSFVLAVIGYSEGTITQTIDEGDQGMLDVEVMKPADVTAHVGAPLLITFQIDNSANTGM